MYTFNSEFSSELQTQSCPLSLSTWMNNRHLSGNLSTHVTLNELLPALSYLGKWEHQPFCASVPATRSQLWFFFFLQPPKAIPQELCFPNLTWSDHALHFHPSHFRFVLDLYGILLTHLLALTLAPSLTPQFSLCCHRNGGDGSKWDIFTPQFNDSSFSSGFLLHWE